MRSERDTVRLESIRTQTVSILREAIGAAPVDVAILDAPNQRNVGDSLIWQGELAYLSQLGHRIRHISDGRSYDADKVREDLPHGGVVLLHGGGNFGDLWYGHQRRREKIVSELRDYRVVQLPQSIFFRDATRAAQANAVLSQHPDFVVLLRDSLSMERAAAQLPGVRYVFCPDMALGYEPPRERVRTPDTVIAIARADLEAASGLRSIEADWMSPLALEKTDWWHDAREPLRWHVARRIARANSTLLNLRRKAGGFPVPQIPQHRLRSAILTINQTNVEYAIDLYSSARAVVADRLHAHVLAALMGIPHVMLDNNYRKLGAVFDDYTHVFETAHYCTDLADARDTLRRALEP